MEEQDDSNEHEGENRIKSEETGEEGENQENEKKAVVVGQLRWLRRRPKRVVN